MDPEFLIHWYNVRQTNLFHDNLESGKDKKTK